MVVAGPGLWQYEALFVGRILSLEFFVCLWTVCFAPEYVAMIYSILLMEAVILFLVDQIQAFQCPTPILICSVYLLYGFLQGVLYHPHSLFRTEKKGQSQRQEARVFFFLVHIKGLQQFISNPLFVKSGHI